ncbi:MAG: hypothetical protein NT051_02285 [Candidatus Micrarchaeota archaeon]|nr:hypothetical protein [Candidatus Micrarchaeota archaeon]
MSKLLDFPFLKKQPAQPVPEPKEPEPENGDELKLKLYRLVIDRYREEIEAHETKSVSDLKALILPRGEKIIEIRDSILESFRPYIYQEHFLPAAKMCQAFISSFKTVQLPVSFWLDFAEMKQLMAGDEIEKSILLCSLLRSIGSENAKVIVTDAKSSYVAFEYVGKQYLAGHQGAEISEFPGWQECLGAIKGKAIYSFNDNEYEDFQEAD